jgi:hypothetical protein
MIETVVIVYLATKLENFLLYIFRNGHGANKERAG